MVSERVSPGFVTVSPGNATVAFHQGFQCLIVLIALLRVRTINFAELVTAFGGKAQ
jgi:hypothetical protein